jgi:hypothetical protein
VEIYLTQVTAVRTGAAFCGVGSPWTGPVSGANPALHSLPAAGTPDARLGAFWDVPAMTRQIVDLLDEPLSVNGNRKQTVHKTRVSAGGYGAMGPHPDREPA